MSLVRPYIITLRLCSGGGAGLRIFTGFREFRPSAHLQVIVPLKLGLKNILIGLTETLCPWLSHTSSHSGCAQGGGAGFRNQAVLGGGGRT